MRVLYFVCAAFVHTSALKLPNTIAGRRITPRARHARVEASVASTAAPTEEAELLELLSSGSSGRGASLSATDTARVHKLSEALEASAASDASAADTNDSPLLPGRWRVLYQGKPSGEKVSFFSVESWVNYASGKGPSPIQNLVSSSSGVSRLYQVLQLAADGAEGRILNVVDASPAAIVAIEADLEGRLQANRLGFRFSGGRVLLRTLWNGTLSLPYPVPFELLGDNAKGWLSTDYITPRLRLSRGNKGSLFVLFGTADDYEELIASLKARGHPTVIAPLQFTDWLRLIPASLTPAYWKGELSPDVALPFYYEALDKAAEELAAAYPGRPISLVAHSIGGWITRAYLGQLSAEQRSRFGTLVTLGTPHRPPPDGLFRTLDQTRGLLSFVEESYPGAFHPELRYLTVGSTVVKGQTPAGGEGGAGGSGRTLEGLLAMASYLPLCGDAFVDGDGITPWACATLDGAEQRDVEAFHIAFVPGNGQRLLGTPWYGSAGIFEQWADFLE